MLDRPKAVGTVAQRARVAIRRHGRKLLRWREKLRLSEEAVHLVLAGCVGVVGGMVNLALYWLNVGVQGVALSSFGDVLPLVEQLDGWQRLLLPAGGGLLAGLALFLGLRLVRMPGATNLMEVVVVGDGRLRLRPALVQSMSSVLSIGTGGSIGREGPYHAIERDLGLKVRSVDALAAISIAIVGGLWGCGRDGCGLQRAGGGRGVCRADRIGEFFHDIVCAAGVCIGGGDDGIAEFL
jgi:hypothetical protein